MKERKERKWYIKKYLKNSDDDDDKWWDLLMKDVDE